MKSRRKFHILKIEHLSEDRQGLIFYICRCYSDLPEHKKRRLDELFEKIGGANAAALRLAMTTDESFVKICLDHYIGSPNTLHVLVRRFFSSFPLEEFIR